MNNYLTCPTCQQDYKEYVNFTGALQVVTNQNATQWKKKVTEIIVDGKFHIPVHRKMNYEYETQGNIHLLFTCERGLHFFIKSFDSHTGNTHVDSNSLMDRLASYLTHVYTKEKTTSVGRADYKLLGHIEYFFNQ